jgi:acetyl-CoA synthetase
MSVYQKYFKEKTGDRGELVSFTMEYPENFNFGYDVVDYYGNTEPDKRAVVWCDMEGDSRTFTFQDISRLSNKAANVFLEAGIKKGDRIMLVLKRHYEYWYILPALHKIGAIAVPGTNMLTEDDFLYRLNMGHIRGVVCTHQDDVHDRLLIAVDKCEEKPILWCVRKDIDRFRNITTEIENASDQLERQPTTVEEPMLMYFTSGTTGYPKAVMHNHTYPLAHIITAKYWQQVEEDGLHFTVSETGWAKAAWGKIYGQWLCGCAVMVYDFDNFDPKKLTVIVKEYGVTSFCAPPTVYRYLVKKGMSDMPTLKHATTAGEALSPEVFRKFEEMSGLELMEAFGQTESTLILGNFKGSKSCPGSMGKASPLYHVELMKNDGTFAKDNEMGELVIVPPENGRQLGIFSAYYENEELYQYVWRDGVYHTGDIAWRNEEGYYFFHGRIDDVIKTGGYRVGPYEVENVLMEHPAVLECSVVGIPDTLRGQAIKAFVVLAAGYEPTNELMKELRDGCNSRLAEYKWIRKLEFVTEMPKTISGKIRRVELRERKPEEKK